jgi:prepilin peptidase CpaA
MSIAIWLTLAACFIASYCDVQARRIPNWLTGSLALAAVLVHAFGGWKALGISVLVMGVMTAGGTLLYSRGGIGGGDIKLAIAGAGMLSWPLCVPFLLYTGIGGGVLAIVFLILRGGAKGTVTRLALMTAGGTNGVAAERGTLPYAVAFAFGAILLALGESVAPFLRIHLS